MEWRKIGWLGLLCGMITGCSTDPLPQGVPVQINEDLEVVRLTDHAYVYTAWDEIDGWGRVGSNGLIVVDDGKALMVDSPMTSAQTALLVKWVEEKLQVRLESFVPGHWHSDCVGGMAWLNQQGVQTYAYEETNRILRSQGKEPARESFRDSLRLEVGDLQIGVYFLGGGHATDNVVAWLPEDKVLFGGCMLKDTTAHQIGNISDAASPQEWMQTVERLESRFPAVEWVVPGHGPVGGTEIFDHTKQVIREDYQPQQEK